VEHDEAEEGEQVRFEEGAGGTGDVVGDGSVASALGIAGERPGREDRSDKPKPSPAHTSPCSKINDPGLDRLAARS
jgi:hypothetical protein